MSQLVLMQLISTKTNRGLPNGMVVFGLATSHGSEIVSKRVQVRPGDQPGYPKDTIESFVGHSSMGLLFCKNGKSKFSNLKSIRSFTSFQMFHDH